MIFTNNCEKIMDKLSFSTMLDHMVRQLPGFAAWKTPDSKYASANQLCASLAGYKTVDDYIETTDYHWKCPAVEFAERIQAQDQYVFENKSSWRSFNILKFSSNEYIYYISNKSIIYAPCGEMMGLLFLGTVIHCSEIIKSLHALLPPSQNQNNVCNILQIVNEDIQANLSQRQSECLFYMIRGKTSKEIAQILHLSYRTVEDYIQQTKDKFRCHTKSQLMEKAMEQGYWYQIPTSLIKKNGVILV